MLTIYLNLQRWKMKSFVKTSKINFCLTNINVFQGKKEFLISFNFFFIKKDLQNLIFEPECRKNISFKKKKLIKFWIWINLWIENVSWQSTENRFYGIHFYQNKLDDHRTKTTCSFKKCIFHDKLKSNFEIANLQEKKNKSLQNSISKKEEICSHHCIIIVDIVTHG